MSDYRWMSKQARFERHNDGSQTMAEFLLDFNGDLLDHAEAADELIAELAAALRQQVGLHYAGWTDPGNALTNAKNVLARVDALTKDTA